jgi:hypothetical protein
MDDLGRGPLEGVPSVTVATAKAARSVGQVLSEEIDLVFGLKVIGPPALLAGDLAFKPPNRWLRLGRGATGIGGPERHGGLL